MRGFGLGPGPAWARARLGPGLGLGPGPAWAQAWLGPGPSPSATCLAQGFMYGVLVFASPEPGQSGSHLFFLGGSCRVRRALRKAGRAFPRAGLHTPWMACDRACDLPCARTFVCLPFHTCFPCVSAPSRHLPGISPDFLQFAVSEATSSMFFGTFEIIRRVSECSGDPKQCCHAVFQVYCN